MYVFMYVSVYIYMYICNNIVKTLWDDNAVKAYLILTNVHGPMYLTRFQQNFQLFNLIVIIYFLCFCSRWGRAKRWWKDRGNIIKFLIQTGAGERLLRVSGREKRWESEFFARLKGNISYFNELPWQKFHILFHIWK